jgi:hypothetical protein
MAADTIMGPVHPGEILLEEFLKPLAVSQYLLTEPRSTAMNGVSFWAAGGWASVVLRAGAGMLAWPLTFVRGVLVVRWAAGGGVRVGCWVR